jgi:regulatory protein
MTKNEALSKAMKLCSGREYAPSELEQKILGWNVPMEITQEIIQELIKEKFLDEFRMARYFVNDKYRFNKWGKVKIRYFLQQKGISGTAITEALNQINNSEYLSTLKEELLKKKKTIKDTDEFHIKAKLFQFASGRGFEAEVIYTLLGNLSEQT